VTGVYAALRLVELRKRQLAAQLQCDAACCNALQCVCEDIKGHHVGDLVETQLAAQLQSVVVCCSVLQCAAVSCGVCVNI